MAAPPSYEESTTEGERQLNDDKGDTKGPQRFSIREEVGASRSQHVAAVVAKLLPHVRDRARSGLAKSTLVLIPSDQDCSRRGDLIGFSEDEMPVLIQLEGQADTLEFWSQREALGLLQGQMLATISDNVPAHVEEPPLPERPPPPTKSSFFGRKQSKAVEQMPMPKTIQAPVMVNVQLDEVYFRSETEYGLLQTTGGRAVVLNVEVR